MDHLLIIAFIGIGATLFTDLWAYLRLRLLNIKAPNYALVGRWIAHMRTGQFCHSAINDAAAIKGEQIIGWLLHYLIGIIFAGLLVLIWGLQWMSNPTFWPAMAVGISTVAAPFLIMQPGMGAGIAASRTANPTSARIHSLITHAVFGLGLYLSGLALRHSLQLINAV